ncbi:7706_t:CDS:10 [Paraglomus occultum]|uniref:7706_t:CDS:1 n=1 Tax=Paraglomus occultum TaxID=144539 RepID=A0A9N9BAK6_9GLOM|nr:7706_t:CDS:10 [Paraglomus occultum]
MLHDFYQVHEYFASAQTLAVLGVVVKECSYRRNLADMETAIVHYEAFKNYLATPSAIEQAGTAGSRKDAREKLTRLSKQQFQELSIDVYDELSRRLMNDNEVPYLRVCDEFHPKRNQARRKLATLPMNRFKDLASDVYFELERRYPELKDMMFPSTSQPQNSSLAAPQKLTAGVTLQAPQSNTIVPEMGTLKEESIEVDFTIQKHNNSRPETPNTNVNINNNVNANNYPPIPNGMPPEYNSPRSPGSRVQSSASSVSDYGRRYLNGMSVSSISSASSRETRVRDTTSSQKSKNDGVNFASLDTLMEDLGNLIDVKKPNGDVSNTSLQAVQNIPEKLNEDVRTDSTSATRIRELEQLLEKQIEANNVQAIKITRLEEELKELNEEHSHQLEVANDVRKQATSLLEEIKSLSRQNEELLTEKEKDTAKIKELTTQVNDWKSKYEKVKIDLRNLKATSSFVKEHPKIDVIKDNSLAPSSDGAVEEAKIMAYQVAIDGLLRAGRSEVPTNVIMAMKAILVACKDITGDVEQYEQQKSVSMKAEDKEKLYAMKSKLSGTLTNLMTAAKNHATGSGISPVSLLDAAASHLTVAVVDLVKLIKIKRSDNDKDKLNVDSLSPSRSSTPTTPPTSQKLQSSRNDASSVSASKVDTFVDERNDRESINLADFKAYLERQTEAIVQAIQTLLSAIRNGSYVNEVTDSITTITTIVQNVIVVARDSFNSPAGESFADRGKMILKDLEISVDKLDQMRDSISSDREDFANNKILKQSLASAAFDIAKFTKGLVGLIE